MPGLKSNSVRIFFSYSRQDLALKDKLKVHLSTLKRQGLVSCWDDRELIAGQEWDQKIKSALNESDIILLLVSSDFLDSDYCYDIEIRRAMERHELGEARVIPVILRSSDWKQDSVPFNKLTALPVGANPVDLWPNKDQAFLEIIQEIRKVAEDIIEQRQSRLDARSDMLQSYFEKYRDNYGKIKILKMPHPVNLEDIYTRVSFVDPINNPYASTEDMERKFLNRKKDKSRNSDEDGFSVVNEHSFLMLLGAPGAGKSTFLRRIGLEALKSDHENSSLFKHSCIPVFLELKKFRQGTTSTPQNIDVASTLVEELNTLGFSCSEADIVELLTNGEFLILLDSLDEVPKHNLDNVIKSIQYFVEKYDKNRFIVSCRTAAYRSCSTFERFRDIELADFSDEQIKQFINNWFCSPADIKDNTAEKCWNVLSSDSHKASKDLASTPLLLTFLCLTYGRIENFPQERTDLYRRALDILLEEWAADKRLQQDGIRGLSPQQEKLLLAEIAYGGFDLNRFFFTRTDLMKQINKFMEDVVGNTGRVSSDIVLTDIAIQQGILVERLDTVYSFSHLTLQEYLTG